MHLTIDPFTGGMLGLATGDALGAPHEGGVVEKLVWKVIGRTRDGCLRWTDDTQMALDLAESLLEEGGLRPDALARRFAASYRWSRGYGPGAARVLKRIGRGEPWESAAKAIYPEGSFGNGAAMRAPVLALFFAGDRDALLEAAGASARITHAHPLGIEGARLIALAAHGLLEQSSTTPILDVIRSACAVPEMTEKLKTASSWLLSEATPTPKEVAAKLGNGMTAPTSCPTALYIALRYLQLPFEEMMRFTIACGGDVDTIAAMAGALWGIANGPATLPAVDIERRDDIVDVASRLHRRHARPAAGLTT
ncbi:MAG: ADP-ribosylglycohydrolase family protein [Minicystis sp.]